MKQRCLNPCHPAWGHYGGRGITVCKRWRNSFKAFFADMGQRSSPKHSIDRYPDNDGNYEPRNCRWATQLQQSANRRQRYRRKTAQFNMRITAAFKRMVETAAAAERRSLASLIEKLLADHCREHGFREDAPKKGRRS
jgi:hypothetical protein